MPDCDQCGREVTNSNLKTCVYCMKNFCPECYDKHMAWELRHKSLAEESSKLWRKKQKGSQESIS